jgi:hypothetical protein
MSEHHYHAVIWIDHHEARVFHFNPTDVERLILHPDHPTRHIHHKANSIGSGHASEDHDYLHAAAESIADAGSHYGTSQCKDRTGQAHSPPRSPADECHRRSGNCRSSKRRTTRCLCATLLQGGGSNAAAEAVGAEPIFPNDRAQCPRIASTLRILIDSKVVHAGVFRCRKSSPDGVGTTVPRLIRMSAIEVDRPQGEPLPCDESVAAADLVSMTTCIS